ncbi:hypothetical protein MPC4_10175 [Methylocella tundrae]|uniref:Uncharacterized protein n=1 Tax=Methylocella tundrae TaxID=227605 RepID=A0A8B6M0J2_METTU|nr:hypothetical protein MPC1_6590002 [Methylocella tundrae]VTZ48225.1 hypothetical protein MPC4_10175 [Methylocella tundrae]
MTGERDEEILQSIVFQVRRIQPARLRPLPLVRKQPGQNRLGVVDRCTPADLSATACVQSLKVAAQVFAKRPRKSGEKVLPSRYPPQPYRVSRKRAEAVRQEGQHPGLRSRVQRLLQDAALLNENNLQNVRMSFHGGANRRRDGLLVRSASDERSAIFFAASACQTLGDPQQTLAMDGERPDRQQTAIVVDHRYVDRRALGQRARRGDFAKPISRALRIVLRGGGEFLPGAAQGFESVQIFDGYDFAPEAVSAAGRHVVGHLALWIEGRWFVIHALHDRPSDSFGVDRTRAGLIDAILIFHGPGLLTRVNRDRFRDKNILYTAG